MLLLADAGRRIRFHSSTDAQEILVCSFRVMRFDTRNSTGIRYVFKVRKSLSTYVSYQFGLFVLKNGQYWEPWKTGGEV